MSESTANNIHEDLDGSLLRDLRNKRSVLLSVDYGHKRVGLAVSDRSWKFSSAKGVLKNTSYTSLREDLHAVAKEYNTTYIVLGFPLNADGTLSSMAQTCLNFARDFTQDYPEFTIFLQDEHLSSHESEERLSFLGATNKQRKSKVDKLAAEVILSRFLERANGAIYQSYMAQDQELITGILNFWFKDLSPQDWFTQSPLLDEKIKYTYGALLQQIVNGDKKYWLEDPYPCLAYILVCDQFARSIWRGGADIYLKADPFALFACKQAIEKRFNSHLDDQEQRFIYMPFMHSEVIEDQDLAVKYFESDRESFHYALHHRAIIERFGRFPHRNIILGRQSTPEEIQYLESPSAFKG